MVVQGSQAQLQSEDAHLRRRYALRHLRATEQLRKKIFRDEAATARILGLLRLRDELKVLGAHLLYSFCHLIQTIRVI